MACLYHHCILSATHVGRWEKYESRAVVAATVLAATAPSSPRPAPLKWLKQHMGAALAGLGQVPQRVVSVRVGSRFMWAVAAVSKAVLVLSSRGSKQPKCQTPPTLCGSLLCALQQVAAAKRSGNSLSVSKAHFLKHWPNNSSS
eukprot:CAMPEP_0204589902 /NCGR_PEP_ID=MMETSP0661-20131031/49474_1 /ASSEMBLY_ACC=CAM_ASM_000606 /TAXON_ID=109239 /ORGANISM="Alexandrium margalefi, Strain AMGDE01CS-322" /LENGTH=143 /DNA_ID=CAMNT_0051599871 /DNA_START=17 /DNA_END=447 /DNA_ORIENTATION=+